MSPYILDPIRWLIRNWNWEAPIPPECELSPAEVAVPRERRGIPLDCGHSSLHFTKDRTNQTKCLDCYRQEVSKRG